MLSDGSRMHLLAVARHAVARHLGLPSSPPPPPPEEDLFVRRPVFVTLTVNGKLRGCVGNMNPPGALAETVSATAVNSASSDPRFAPITAGEFPRLHIEISILTSPVPASGPADILPGTHGVIVSQGPRRGLLLPQVAVEQRWTAETFLEQTCVKAGLRPDSWRAGARIETFTAEVFGET